MNRQFYLDNCNQMLQNPIALDELRELVTGES
jgi:hypothetical protein